MCGQGFPSSLVTPKGLVKYKEGTQSNSSTYAQHKLSPWNAYVVSPKCLFVYSRSLHTSAVWLSGVCSCSLHTSAVWLSRVCSCSLHTSAVWLSGVRLSRLFPLPMHVCSVVGWMELWRQDLVFGIIYRSLAPKRGFCLETDTFLECESTELFLRMTDCLLGPPSELLLSSCACSIFWSRWHLGNNVLVFYHVWVILLMPEVSPGSSMISSLWPLPWKTLFIDYWLNFYFLFYWNKIS